jgi:transposase-like protein
MSRGPDLARRELWRRRLREYERSNSTIADFCDRAGVSTAAFYQWRRKLADAASPEGAEKDEGLAKRSPAVASLNFLPVEIMEPRNGGVVEVLLPNGIRVLVPSCQESLRTVLESLASEWREDRPC